MQLRSDWVFLVPVILSLFLLFYEYPQSETLKLATMALSGTIITVTASVYGIVLNNRMGREKEIKLRQFERKAEAYTNYFTIVNKMLMGMKEDDFTKNPLAIEFLKFKLEILTWGDENVIRMVKTVEEPSDDTTDPGEKFNRIAIALRSDLGHTDSKKFKPFNLLLTYKNKCE